MEYDEFSAMNTTVLLAAEGNPADLTQGFAQARQAVAAYEQHFSRFRPDSELSALNRAAGTWFRASPEMFAVVSQALEFTHLSEGLFDPGILNALTAAGYDRSMDEIRARGAAQAPAFPARASLPFAGTRLDPPRRAVRLPDGLHIDLGGIAKGWIAGQAARTLAGYSPACAVSAGGDMEIIGFPAGQSAWPISLEDPRDPAQVLAVLHAGPGGVATSSVTKRKWVQAGQPRHHIIDPRSGQPVQSEFLSVTALAESAAHAEALAKALLIAGAGAADRLLARLSGNKIIAVRPDGSLWQTAEMMESTYVFDRSF